jgi:3-deoxy-D-manno-octulosonic acid (KDO) 8-phosphate synthase
LSDGPNSLDLKDFERLLQTVKAIDSLTKGN